MALTNKHIMRIQMIDGSSPIPDEITRYVVSNLSSLKSISVTSKRPVTGQHTTGGTDKQIAVNTKIKVANQIYDGYYRIITPPGYTGFYIPTWATSPKPMPDPDPPKDEEGEDRTENPGETPSAEPSKFTLASISNVLQDGADTIKDLGRELHRAKQEEQRKKAAEAAALRKAVKQASPTSTFVPNDQLYNFRTITGEPTSFNDSYQMAISDFTNAFGSPFLYSNDTDPCYYANTEGGNAKEPYVGHTMMSTIYSSPAVFSICPGKVTYLPNLMSGGKSIFESMADLFSGKSVLAPEDIIGASKDSGAFARQLYSFTPDYNDYINRLNTIARISALFMGIGDRTTPWNKATKYKTADYSYFTTGKRNSQKSKPDVVDNFLWQLTTGFEDGIDTTTDKYIHFFLTADGSAVEQDFITSPSSIDLFDDLNGGTTQKKIKEISFLFNGAMSNSDTWKTIEDDLGKLGDNIGSSSDTIGSLMTMVKGWAQGGRMLIPDMIDEVQYNSSVTCHLNFRSLYGDPESVFLNVNLPCLALLCFVLPKQMAENMYGYPYICRCFQRGFYNSDLCFISNLSFRRGGDAETSWTETGIATEVEATFTITPLYSALMGGNGRNPYLFMSNTALVEYLGNMCGLDIKADQIKLKTDLIKNLFVDNFLQDIPNNFARKTSDWASGKLEKLFRFN